MFVGPTFFMVQWYLFIIIIFGFYYYFPHPRLRHIFVDTFMVQYYVSQQPQPQ